MVVVTKKLVLKKMNFQVKRLEKNESKQFVFMLVNKILPDVCYGIQNHGRRWW